jgi:mitochondrial fission protein ELM1
MTTGNIPTGPAPRVWLVVGEKPGDNAQIRIVAEALGWPAEQRQVVMREPWAIGKPRVRASLHHVDLDRSDPLTAPWPDLLITKGRRLSMVALWVKRQSAGRCRIVLLGKPRRLLRQFDLVLAAAEYRVPRRPNVLRLALPLLRVDEDAVKAAAEAWRERLAILPRPLTAVLVGGPTGKLRFDPEVAGALMARTLAASGGVGSLYVTTSRRTPLAVVEALARDLPAGSRLHRWRDGASADNPYLALLGLADRFVVSSDSLSMMVEVARLGRPLALYELPPAAGRWRRLGRSRDLGAIPRLLFERDLAVPLGEPFRAPGGSPPDDLQALLPRLRGLFDSLPAGAGGAPPHGA